VGCLALILAALLVRGEIVKPSDERATA
jgi:hypothetical protein